MNRGLDGWQDGVLAPTAGRPAEILFILWAAILPFDNVLTVQGFGTMAKYLGMFVAVTIIIDRLTRGKGRLKKPGLAAIAWGFFIAFAVASASWSIEPSKTLTNLSTIVELYILYLVVVSCPWSVRTIKHLQRAIMAGGCIAAALSIYSFFMGKSFLTATRATLVINESSMADPNHFATSLILPFIFALEEVVSSKRTNYFGSFAIGIITFAIILSGSRGALLGIICAICVLMLRESRSGANRVVRIVIIVFTILFLVSNIVPESLAERYSFESIITSEGSHRLPLWHLAFLAFKQKPLLGWGYGTFASLSTGQLAAEVTGHLKVGLVAHSIYFQILSELGILGFGLLISSLAFSFLHGSKNETDPSFFTPVCAAYVGIAATSGTLCTLNYKYFWLIQMLIVLTVYPVQGSSSSRGERYHLSNSMRLTNGKRGP